MSSHLARSIFELITLYTPFLKHRPAPGAQFNLKVICTAHGILLSSLIMIIISFGTQNVYKRVDRGLTVRDEGGVVYAEEE